MPQHSDTLASRLGRLAQQRADSVDPPLADSDRVRSYAQDPIGFARDVLGIQPWSKQGQILRAVLAHKRVAVASGHKVGKSTALAVLALWFYCSFRGARVVITATTDRLVNGIIWRENKRLCRGARLPIPNAGDIKIRANGGLTDPTNDFAEIRGYTAKEAEAIAGISGAFILYLVDEASGVADAIYQAIEGNRAAGSAWVFLISNPTKADGEFYDAFHSKSKEALPKAGYHTIHIDSRDSPNVTGEWRALEEWDSAAEEWRLRGAPVPGLASPEWVEEKLEDWGEDSALFKIRVAGLFCAAEDAKVFSATLITECTARYDDTEATGRLYLGIDPAGDGDGGDEGGLVARRGCRVLDVRTVSGLSPEGYCVVIDDLVAQHHASGAPQPIVNIESEGEAGWKVYCTLRDHAAHGRYRVNRVRTSDRAVRNPRIFDRMRDEIWAVAREWARAGGAFPPHVKLEKDLHAPEFTSDLRGRQKITSKKDLRKILGRSPDAGDALVLSCWEPMFARQEDDAADAPAAPIDDDEQEIAGMNPYTALKAWGR